MYAKLTDEVIMEVLKIFLDAGVQEVPNPSEIREEFEIIDKVFITNEMIKNVELDIAGYLDHKYGTGDAHIQGLLGKWTYQNR